jgi:hypothetical protein
MAISRRKTYRVCRMTVFFGYRPRPVESLMKCAYFIVVNGVVRDLVNPPWLL